MNTSFNFQYLPAAFALLLITGIAPSRGMAQRFNHAPAPARSYSPPPQPTRAPAPPPVVRQPVPVQQPRQSINGGGRNIGNHDFNQNRNTQPVRENNNPPVQQKNIVHDNVSVYHTGAYHGLKPYTYHPFHPYYWGPRWHPVGYFIGVPIANAYRFSFANQWYYYDDGTYYEPYNDGYTVVLPPIGAQVNYLPDGYETIPLGDDTYYYYGGVFYIGIPQGYQVVQAPVGAVVSQLPAGATEQDINGETFIVYNGAYYQPISQDGQDAYEVVPGS